MKREFFINIFLLILANLLIKPIYLLWIDVKVQNLVGPSTYGLYLSLFSLCYILQFIADPGLLNYNTTYISGNRSGLKDRFGIMLGLKLSLSVLFFLAVAIVSKFIDYSPEALVMLKWVAINVALLSGLLYLRSNVSSMGFFRWDSLFSIIDKVLLIIILVFLIYIYSNKDQFHILWFIYAQTASLAITITIILIFTHIKAVKLNLKFDFKYFRRILTKSLPFAWLLFFMTLYTRIDSFMLERLLNDNAYQAGVYAAGFRLFEAGNSFAYLFGVLLLPMFSQMISEKVSTLDLFRNSSLFLWVLAVSGTISCLFWSEDIMRFFYEDYTIMYAQVFGILMLAFIPLALGFVYGSLLTAKKELKRLNWMAFSGVILNISLNYLLIHKMGARGAALATLGTQCVILIIQAYFVMNIFGFKPKKKMVMRFLIFITICLGINYGILKFSHLHFWINFAFAIIISIFASLILKVLPYQSISELLEKRLKKNK